MVVDVTIGPAAAYTVAELDFGTERAANPRGALPQAFGELLMLGPEEMSEKAVAELNRRWMQAYVNGDVGFLEQHMSEDYVGTFPDGTVLDRQGEIEAVKSGAVIISEMTPKQMNVRVYGNSAVITGRSHIEAVVAGQPMSADFRFTDVWIVQGGSWRAVASQVTRIEQVAG